MTRGQSKFLYKNKDHLKAVAELVDGDILVVDLGASCDRRGIVTSEFGPYILTKDGGLHSVPWHYHHYHGMTDVPCALSYMKRHDEFNSLMRYES